MWLKDEPTHLKHTNTDTQKHTWTLKKKQDTRLNNQLRTMTMTDEEYKEASQADTY